MARNKLALLAHDHGRQKRDARRTAEADGLAGQVADDAPSPSRLLAGREWLEALRGRLSAEERRIADEVGNTPEGRRKQFRRAADQAIAELGLDPDDLCHEA